MTPSKSRTALLATSAVLTLGFASAVVAQQPGSTQPQAGGSPQMQNQQSSQQGSQANLKQHIATLEQSRKQISDAQPNQLQQLKQPVVQALNDLEKDLQSMQGQQKQAATKSIDDAQKAMEGQADKNRIIQALDSVLKDVRQLQTAGLSGSSGLASSGQASSGQDARGAEISVQQKSPQVAVQQPAPQVTVQQPPPQVTVQQPRPEVKIEQAQPKVTVDQAKPQVTVEKQGEPKITVEQQRQAQVKVQGAESGSNRQPAATNEKMRSTESGSSRPSTATDTTTTTGPGMSLANSNREQLVGKDIYGADNRNIGEVEDVVIGSNAKLQSVLVDVGGFLGIGARRVAIPVEKLSLQGDRLVSQITEQEARSLPEYKAAQ